MKVKILSPIEINLEEIEEPMSVSLRELGAIPEFETEGINTVLLPYSYEVEVEYIVVTPDRIHFGKELTPEALQKIIEYERLGQYRIFHKEGLMELDDIFGNFGVLRSTIGLHRLGFDEVSMENLPEKGTIVLVPYKVAG